MKSALTATVWAFGVLLAVGVPGRAATDGAELFEKRIRPLLTDKCYGCHSAAAKKLKGELRLDTKAGVLAGGEHGPVVRAGRPEESRLIKAVRRADPDTAMPPRDELALTDEQIADLVAWVKLGAPDPRAEKPEVTGPKVKAAAAQTHWAFQPVPAVAPPRATRQPALVTAIDRFLLAQLAGQQLTFAPPAPKRTLLRRATFDLTGLPPTPDELTAFLEDTSTGAFAHVVDRLLASNRYGEQWGRHWLDVVRYADTSGCNSDYPVPTAYLYRNWVIAAFNADQPYDQFLRDQLAGDLLSAPAGEAHRQQIIATGYLAIARRFGSRASEFHLTIEDTIDNVGKAMLGLSVNCARCHDHKFDPITAHDYYALYGIFNSTRYAFPGTEIYKHPKDFVPLANASVTLEYFQNAETLAVLDDLVEKLLERKKGLDRATQLVVVAIPGSPGRAPVPPDPVPGQAPALANTPNRWTNLPPNLALLLQPGRASADPGAMAKAPAGRPVERKDLIRIPDEWTLADVKGALFDAQGEQKKLERKIFDNGTCVKAYAVADQAVPANARIQKKGDPGALGDEVQRGFLELLGGQKVPADAPGSGRRELAGWITDPGNPLTARVLVNRIWQGHFGRGLVPTPNDFGTRGKPPTHPELLDWLASEFIKSGWSVKAMHRAVMLSQAYQQASEPGGSGSAAALSRPADADPNNDLLGHFPRRRLTAEELRDALLFVAGTLDLTPGGPHPFPAEPTWTYTQHQPFIADYPSDRRSVYLFQQRIRRNPYLELFDGADPNATTAVRATASSPLQALFALNSPLAHEAADRFAVRVGLACNGEAERIRYAYALAFGRLPATDEIGAGLAYLRQLRAVLAGGNLPADQVGRAALASYGRVLLGSNEFIFVD